MRDRLYRHRVELLLLSSLLLPLLVPSGIGLDGFVAGSVLPAIPSAPASVPPEDEQGWKELALMLMAERAELRERLLALGKPARLVAYDKAYWERQPLRVEAAVLGRDVAPWRGSLVVSAGRREGVREGLAAVVGDSLIGTVAEVGRLASRVRLLSDPGHRVWATLVGPESQAEGVVVGTGEIGLDMRLAKAGVGRIGDPVFTSGGDFVVPRGLLLGTVEEIGDLDRDGVAEIVVGPGRRPGEISFVHILVTREED